MGNRHHDRYFRTEQVEQDANPIAGDHLCKAGRKSCKGAIGDLNWISTLQELALGIPDSFRAAPQQIAHHPPIKRTRPPRSVSEQAADAVGRIDCLPAILSVIEGDENVAREKRFEGWNHAIATLERLAVHRQEGIKTLVGKVRNRDLLDARLGRNDVPIAISVITLIVDGLHLTQIFFSERQIFNYQPEAATENSCKLYIGRLFGYLERACFMLSALFAQALKR